MMLTPQGVVKLMDFGIARSATDGSLTTTGTTLGSLNYMPPEQVRGEAADARSDIYSFGVSLYEMLTGKLPFKGDSQYSLMTAHLNETPPTPITLRADLPAGLSEIIMMAIAKDPANRFQSADAFRAALNSVEVSPLPASSTTVTPTSRSSGATTLIDTPYPARTPTTPAPPRPPTPAPATLRPTSPPQPPPAAQPVSVARPSSSRGMWLAIGAVLGIAVLIAAGMYIPRHLGTHADPSKEKSAANGNGANASNPGDASGTSSKPVVSLQNDQGSIKVDANGNVSMESPKGSVQVDAQSGAVSISSRPPIPLKNNSNGNPTPSRGDSLQTPAPPPGPTPEEIAKIEDEADKLNVRAATATQSVETLRKQQMATGYNLRADIASAEERMQLYMAKGNSALKAQDLQNAQKYFDLADTELGKLEKFLGH
jgi:serine/threonine-protein kinase